MERYTLDSKEGSIPDSVVMRPDKDGEYVLLEDAKTAIEQSGAELAKMNALILEGRTHRDTHIKSLESKLHEVQDNVEVLLGTIDGLNARSKYLEDARDTAVDALCEAVAMMRDMGEV